MTINILRLQTDPKNRTCYYKDSCITHLNQLTDYYDFVIMYSLYYPSFGPWEKNFVYPDCDYASFYHGNSYHCFINKKIVENYKILFMQWSSNWIRVTTYCVGDEITVDQANNLIAHGNNTITFQGDNPGDMFDSVIPTFLKNKLPAIVCVGETVSKILGKHFLVSPINLSYYKLYLVKQHGLYIKAAIK